MHADWLLSMIELDLGDGIVAQSLQTSDAQAVHESIISSRVHLDRWLRWSSSLRTQTDVQEFIARFESMEALGDGFHLGIWDNRTLAGGVVCWYINRENQNAEVGYWLCSNFTGKGLATRAAQAVVEYLFDVENLHRVEMQCGVENFASRAVAERCGLSMEGIRRESHWITDRFVDHVVYGLLATK